MHAAPRQWTQWRPIEEPAAVTAGLKERSHLDDASERSFGRSWKGSPDRAGEMNSNESAAMGRRVTAHPNVPFQMTPYHLTKALI
ncbi:hypothetical protein Dda_1412 [Drechslerella dactyloides]|uniref:Uncharacterized protein n=1 Tax=Drechslerella dactyloides TaxID=74499 RepID=A0AAD6NLY8_DREDA|nr:hypothetical protein Dda_1412 [Drechslerella dactyloides]